MPACPAIAEGSKQDRRLRAGAPPLRKEPRLLLPVSMRCAVWLLGAGAHGGARACAPNVRWRYGLCTHGGRATRSNYHMSRTGRVVFCSAICRLYLASSDASCNRMAFAPSPPLVLSHYNRLTDLSRTHPRQSIAGNLQRRQNALPGWRRTTAYCTDAPYAFGFGSHRRTIPFV